MSADAHTLRRSLIAHLALEPDAADEQAVYADAIKTGMLEQVCVSARLEGRCVTYAQYYAALYRVTLDGRALKAKKA